MKILINEIFKLKVKHSSSNQLKFARGRAYRPQEYTQNSGEMLQKFMGIDFNIPEKEPLGVAIDYYYPEPKKGGLPITRSTKDLDSTKAVLDSLMKAGKQKSQNFDDSQVVIETLSKRYWDESDYGLSIAVVLIEDDDEYAEVGSFLGGMNEY